MNRVSAHLGFVAQELERDRVRNFERQGLEVEGCVTKLEVYPQVLHASASSLPQVAAMQPEAGILIGSNALAYTI